MRLEDFLLPVISDKELYYDYKMVKKRTVVSIISFDLNNVPP